jgi:hypothetical protein
MWTKLMRLARHPIVRKITIALLVALIGDPKKSRRKQ